MYLVVSYILLSLIMGYFRERAFRKVFPGKIPLSARVNMYTRAPIYWLQSVVNGLMTTNSKDYDTDQ